MPYPTPPPEPPSIIQTVPVPESLANSVMGEVQAPQTVEKQLHQPSTSFSKESALPVSSSPEAIASIAPRNTHPALPLTADSSSSHFPESPGKPTSVTQATELRLSESEHTEAASLAPEVSAPESIPLAAVPQFASPEASLSHSVPDPEAIDVPPAEVPGLDALPLSSEPTSSEPTSSEPTIVTDWVTDTTAADPVSIPLPPQRPAPPLLPTAVPSLNAVSATRETGLQPVQREPVDIAATDFSKQLIYARAHSKTKATHPLAFAAWVASSVRGVSSSQDLSLSQGASQSQNAVLPQITPLQQDISPSSQRSGSPVSTASRVSSTQPLATSDATKPPDLSAPNVASSFPSSTPIPPLSQVIELPPLATGTFSAPTLPVLDNPLPSVTNLTDVSSAAASTVPTSTPIPPLSQVIPLPSLAGEYPTTPIPVTQDVGLQVSSSERTEASFLSPEKSSSPGPNSVYAVPTTAVMARLRAHERTRWNVSSTDVSLTDAILQTQTIEPGSRDSDSDVDAVPDESDRPILNEAFEGDPHDELEDEPSNAIDAESTVDDVNREDPAEESNTGGEDESEEDPDGESEGDSDGESEEDPNADEADANENESDLEDSASQFPRAARPEPFWNNGAITNDGILLTPSEPTNQPAVPLRLTADYQEFEPLRQVVTARGDVLLQLGNGVLAADRLWANLFNRYVLVEGNVVFRRGEQIIEGERGEYNLLQGQGSLFDASGTLFIPDVGDDFATITSGADADADAATAEDVRREEPITGVISTGGITVGTGNTGGVTAGASGDGVRRIRFEAAQVDFDAEGWVARDVRLTNDPFSPPELEIRGDTATLAPLNELEDELVIENPRLVFDQGFSLPLLRSRYIFSRGDDNANPLAFGIGFDGEERSGLFIERTFTVATTPRWDFRVTPQLLVQRLTREDDDGTFASNFGLVADLNGQLNPTTTLRATADFSGLDLDNFENRLRASVRLRQQLGQHTLNWEYSYRDRLFNGSLGFQNVQSSLGAVLVSPDYTLGDTGIVLNYQIGAQYITALTDQDEFLEPFETEELVSLGRFQGSIGLSKVFTLWRGRPLPRTPDQGLRFTPSPVVPNIRLILRTQGTYSYYTSNDTQESLSASIGIRGQLGQFSRNFLDSTTFNLTYRTSFVGDSSSPFLFDRDVDRNRLSAGIIQQIYGPIRVGFQTNINLDTGDVISTNYIVEYSRRTYGVVIRVNPERRTGFIGFRINDFGWSGRAAAFGGADVDEVEGGVIQEE